jgi:hypothetical protein
VVACERISRGYLDAGTVCGLSDSVMPTSPVERWSGQDHQPATFGFGRWSARSLRDQPGTAGTRSHQDNGPDNQNAAIDRHGGI